MGIQVDYEFINRYVELSEGDLLWKSRNPADFSFGKNTQEQNCNSWNTKYAGKPALSTFDKSTGYKAGQILGNKVYYHRAKWILFYERLPSGEIDHFNRNKLDNHINNLIDGPKIDNTRNVSLRKTNKFGRHGISFIEKLGKYRLIKQKKHIGLYKTLDEAIEACDKIETLLGFKPNHGKS